MKKIISAAVSSVILLSCFSVTAAATNENEDKLPFKLEAPTKLSLSWLNGQDSPTTMSFACSIELTPLAGFDSSVTERIRTALTEYSNSLQIGQSIVVPSLYGLCYGADPAPSPTFSISLLSATAQGTSTSGVVSAAWNQRLMIPANMIQILVAG